jgi:hypothetical protein
MLENYIQALNTKGYIPDWQSTWELTVNIAYERAGKFHHFELASRCYHFEHVLTYKL